MPPHAPPIAPAYQTALDPFRQGAMHAAREGLFAEPQMFDIGFALVPGSVDPMGQPTAWIIKRFSSIPEGVYWMHSIERQGGHIYAAIFTRMSEQPLLESFGHGSFDEKTYFPTTVPMHWMIPGRDY
jgi:hypothetical protein